MNDENFGVFCLIFIVIGFMSLVGFIGSICQKYKIDDLEKEVKGIELFKQQCNDNYSYIEKLKDARINKKEPENSYQDIKEINVYRTTNEKLKIKIVNLENDIKNREYHNNLLIEEIKDYKLRDRVDKYNNRYKEKQEQQFTITIKEN
jgi:hypothetical protein